MMTATWTCSPPTAAIRIGPTRTSSDPPTGEAGEPPLTDYPAIAPSDVAWITEAQMIEVDRTMIEDLHIELVQMMENAGRNLARLVIDAFGPESVVVCSGSGGNGGGGLVTARHLSNAGVDLSVVVTRTDLQGAPGHQLDILRRMGVTIVDGGRADDSLPMADLMIDAVIGYSLRGAPSGASAGLIEHLRRAVTVISLDTPSGLDVTTGATPGSVVTADATLTLALPKVGLRQAPQVGELFLADISVPRSIGGSFGRPAPDFSPGPILRVARS